MEEKSRKKIAGELFATYFTSMLFAFTGGNMTWPLVERQLTEKYKLISKEKALEYFALGQSIPGILSLNTAVLVGLDTAGWAGALAAAAGSVLPAFFGMLIIAAAYTFINGLPFIGAAIGGIRAATIGIICVNAITMLERRESNGQLWVALFAMVATLLLGWNVVFVILGCGLFGVFCRAIFKTGPVRGGKK